MNLALTDTTITLRPITNQDGELLFKIYAATREEELKVVTFWTNEQKAGFLRQQFTAQHTHYQQYYAKAFFWVILQNQLPVGRLYLDLSDENTTIGIIDISLLPDYRGKGIGEGLLKDILKLANKTKTTVRIHVEAMNRAKRLYDRLGFKMVEQGPVYLKMEWAAQATQ